MTDLFNLILFSSSAFLVFWFASPVTPKIFFRKNISYIDTIQLNYIVQKFNSLLVKLALWNTHNASLTSNVWNFCTMKFNCMISILLTSENLSLFSCIILLLTFSRKTHSSKESPLPPLNITVTLLSSTSSFS